MGVCDAKGVGAIYVIYIGDCGRGGGGGYERNV